METGCGVGPDLVIAGAARCGTSFLAARLAQHPAIDPGSVKEPNYFSRNYDRGQEWYSSLFDPRHPGLIRLDASVSYTFPQHSEALGRLAGDAPNVRVVYAVRDPITRAMSHYRLLHTYFQNEASQTFGVAVEKNPVYAGSSDYAHWLDLLNSYFSPEQLLVIPFNALVGPDSDAVISSMCSSFLNMAPPPMGTELAQTHRNDVVTFRTGFLRAASRQLRRSPYYPIVRKQLGPQRLRKLRRIVTREVPALSTEAMWLSCTPSQQESLTRVAKYANMAVERQLEVQGERTGLELLGYWRAPDRTDTVPGISDQLLDGHE